MKEPCGEDLASHADPESCTSGRKGGCEALAGACAGELLSREIIQTGVPTSRFDDLQKAFFNSGIKSSPCGNWPTSLVVGPSLRRSICFVD